MDIKGKLYTRGLEEYPLSAVIGQNAFFVVYFGAGFIGMLPLKIMGFPAVSVLYVLFLVVMLIFVLRREICTNCYYYGKRCSTGWGKLASAMFAPGSGSLERGVKLANITWAIATLTPIIAIPIAVFITRSLYSLAWLGIFVAMTPFSFLLHKSSCMKCKMRFICPASLVKNK